MERFGPASKKKMAVQNQPFLHVFKQFLTKKAWSFGESEGDLKK